MLALGAIADLGLMGPLVREFPPEYGCSACVEVCKEHDPIIREAIILLSIRKNALLWPVHLGLPCWCLPKPRAIGYRWGKLGRRRSWPELEVSIPDEALQIVDRARSLSDTLCGRERWAILNRTGLK
jgi:hypothetical protein